MHILAYRLTGFTSSQVPKLLIELPILMDVFTTLTLFKDYHFIRI